MRSGQSKSSIIAHLDTIGTVEKDEFSSQTVRSSTTRLHNNRKCEEGGSFSAEKQGCFLGSPKTIDHESRYLRQWT